MKRVLFCSGRDKSNSHPEIEFEEIRENNDNRNAHDAIRATNEKATFHYLFAEKLKKLSDDDETAVNDFIKEIKNSAMKISRSVENDNTLVHIAAIHGKSRVLEKLTDDYGCEQINYTRDGDTPIISLLKNKSTLLTCLEVFVRKKADLFKENKRGLNAISYATMRESEERNKCLKIMFPGSSHITASLETIYDALDKRNDITFVNSLNEAKDLTKILKSCMYGKDTLLQSVCKFGMTESVKRLTELELKLDLYFTPFEKNTPIQLACSNAYPHIVKFLISKKAHLHNETSATGYHDIQSNQPVKNADKMNIMHFVTRYLDDSNDSVECLKLLLNETNRYVNQKDKYGRTPLHYAVFRKNVEQIVVLLENGANVNEKDIRGQNPLNRMPEAALKKYLGVAKLDQMIKAEGANDDELKLNFNFNNIFNQNSEGFFFPTKILGKLNGRDSLKNILEHPVTSVIVYFKWRHIRSLYYTYSVSYFIFCLLFSLYIYLSEDHPEPKDLKLNYNKFAPYLINTSLVSKTINMNLFFVVPLTLIIIALTFIELIKIRNVIESRNDLTIIQSIFRWYFNNMDNCLRPIVIVLTSLVILCLNNNKILYCPQIKAFSILALYIELYFVISKHPLISYYEVVFRRSSWHLFRFIICHIVLFVGFALSFHILFRSVQTDNVFTNPLNALFKTIIMFTGEFDASDIPFNDYKGVSHAIFIIYIFFVTIVLLNLMISIALKHYNEMQQNPFLHRTMAEIKHIEHFEYFVESFWGLWECLRCWKTETGKNVNEEPRSLALNIEHARTDMQPVILNTKTIKFETFLDFKWDTNGTVACISNNKNKVWRFFLQFFEGFTSLHDSVIVKATNIAMRNENYHQNEDKAALVTTEILEKEINELKLYIEALLIKFKEHNVK